MSKPSAAMQAVLDVLVAAEKPLRRSEIGLRSGLPWPRPESRTMDACVRRGWVVNVGGYAITDAGRVVQGGGTS